MKNKIFIILTCVLGVACVGLVGFGLWYDSTFFESTKKEVKEMNAYYEETYNNLLADYNTLVAEKESTDKELSQLKADFEVVSTNLENAEKTISDYETEIEAKKLAEEERWNSLTEEEQNAETELKEYSAMVNELIATNEEYAEIHTYIIENLGNDNMTQKQRKEFIKQYKRKLEIEEEYQKSLESAEETTAE